MISRFDQHPEITAGETQGDNEKREKEVDRDEKEQGNDRGVGDDQDLVARLCGENWNFIAVQLGGQTYKALFDPGAMLSLVRPRVAERFEDSLELYRRAECHGGDRE